MTVLLPGNPDYECTHPPRLKKTKPMTEATEAMLSLDITEECGGFVVTIIGEGVDLCAQGSTRDEALTRMAMVAALEYQYTARIPAAPDGVERALRAFADKHSACGEAWNLSSALACVRSAIPIPATGELELDHVKASWWDDAIRAHCAEHGPGGDAWNVSMVLERLHRTTLTAHTTKGDE